MKLKVEGLLAKIVSGWNGSLLQAPQDVVLQSENKKLHAFGW